MPRSEGSEVSIGQVFELSASLDTSLTKVFFKKKRKEKEKSINQSIKGGQIYFCPTALVSKQT